MGGRVRWEVVLRHEPVRADQKWVAGESGEGLVGRVDKAGRPQREHLPDRLPALGQEVDELIGVFA